jgi:hypothetical protein
MDRQDQRRHWQARECGLSRSAHATEAEKSTLSVKPASDAPAAPTPIPTPTTAPASDSQPVKIVPKGLRSFDAHDADFFLELPPGLRDRAGLPDSIASGRVASRPRTPTARSPWASYPGHRAAASRHWPMVVGTANAPLGRLHRAMGEYRITPIASRADSDADAGQPAKQIIRVSATTQVRVASVPRTIALAAESVAAW